MARRRASMWERLQTYLHRGLRLLDAAQVESLGGASRSLALPTTPATSDETSPYFPGNWTEPFAHHFVPAHPWFADEWFLQATGLTIIGGQRRSNRELFDLSDQHRTGMVFSTFGTGHANWRLPSTAIEAGLSAFEGQRVNTLPCHVEIPSQLDAPLCKGAERIRRAMHGSNLALLQLSIDSPGSHVLSSGAVLHFCCGRAWFAQFGALQLYLWRKGKLSQLFAPDDTEPQPQPHPTQRPVAPHWIRYLGFRELPPFEIQSTSVQAGDIFLLVSQGLHGTLTRYAIEQTIGEHTDSLEAACQRLGDVAWNSRYQSADITILMTQVVANRREVRNKAVQGWHEELEAGLF